MNKHIKNPQVPQPLILIGRVDSSQFLEERRRFYGTQLELAKARAEWVRGELLKKFPEIAPGLISVQPAGPQHVGKRVSPEKLALDRSVEVYACWTPKEPDPTSVSAGPTQ